jgi:beta-lactamase superfamily II metal-dependent hydrolase
MKPKYTIQSVGNTMKPKDDAVKKYKELSKNVITTRWKGNVVIECHEDGRIECTPQFK